MFTQRLSHSDGLALGAIVALAGRWDFEKLLLAPGEPPEKASDPRKNRKHDP